MDLTIGQQEFLTRTLEGKSSFLTGKAGTGKSFVVRTAIEELEKEGKRVAAIAPTGIAATNIGGQTIHSLFRLPPFGVLDFDVCNYIKGANRDTLNKIDVFIIDEVSMLRPDTLDAMHWTLKKNGLKGLDQRQMIFVGDLKQLPPVLDDNTRSVLYQTYVGDTFMEALIMPKLNIETIELDEVKRQSDQEFIEALNDIREGKKNGYFARFLHTEPNGIILAPHNGTVASYNESGLRAQDGDLITLTAEITGKAKATEFTFEQEIKVKDGCKIMCLVNSPGSILSNGTIGTLVIRNEKYFISVKGNEYELDQMEQVKKEYVYNHENDKLELKEVGSIKQYPFKLAYALSIHKSQGMTFDEVTVDLKRPCFQKGQMYVALSRVRTPGGLRIII